MSLRHIRRQGCNTPSKCPPNANKNEAGYRDEFEHAVLNWLSVLTRRTRRSPARSPTGLPIERQLSAAVEYGQTKTLSLEERAALAARAFIRHRYTDYEGFICSPPNSSNSINDLDTDIVEVGDYREIKQAAHGDVDAFLDKPSQNPTTGDLTRRLYPEIHGNVSSRVNESVLWAPCKGDDGRCGGSGSGGGGVSRRAPSSVAFVVGVHG